MRGRAPQWAALALVYALVGGGGCDDPAAPVGSVGSFTVVGRGFVATRTSDLWVHGDAAYTGTLECDCGRLYVWDISDPADIALTDSIVVDAYTVNDVKLTEDGAIAVLTHEGSDDGWNGITLLDLSDPLHPVVITRYTGDCTYLGEPSCLSGGIHNLWIDGDHAYLVERAHGVHVVDISDPAHPIEVALFPRGDSHPHDVLVRDGLAFVSHWNDGLVILDVGNGMSGGSPANPVEVSRIVLPNHGPVHNAWYWPEAGYVFIGEESFAEPLGRMHVVDVSDLTAPIYVADYFLAGSPPHNFWLDEDRGILFAAWYSNGLRAIDVTGELRGDLTGQGREYASALAGQSIWAPQVHDGLVFASDVFGGIWALRFDAP